MQPGLSKPPWGIAPSTAGSWGGCGVEESPHPLAHIPSKEGRGIWGQAVPKAEHHIPVWGAFPLARLKGGVPGEES